MSSIESLALNTDTAPWRASAVVLPAPCRTAFTVSEGVNGTAIISGGVDGAGNPLPSVLIFDPAAGTVTLMTSMVAQAGIPANHAALTVNDTLVLLGGVVTPVPLPSGLTPFPFSADVVALGLAGEKLWRQVHTLALPRSHAAAVVVGADIWVIGGSACTRAVTASDGDATPTFAKDPTCAATSSVAILSDAVTATPARTSCSVAERSPTATATAQLVTPADAATKRHRQAAQGTPRSTVAQYPVLPDVSNMGRGIDLTSSDPDAMAADPGLREPVFDLACVQCFSENRTVGSAFRVPDFVSARSAQQCSYEADVSEIHSTYDMQEHLSYWTKSTEHILFWRHTRTQSFSKTEEDTVSADPLIFLAGVHC